jgi:histidine ammonia-lyase
MRVTVVLTGADLTLADLVAIARREELVSIDPDAIDRMKAARDVVERALARDDPVYGLTTGLGAGATRLIGPGETAAQRWASVRSHLVGQGPAFAAEVVRAAATVVANGFASGWSGVRPELAKRYVDAVNEGHLPSVRSLGSVGQADLAALAELAMGVLDGVDLAAGESLALLSSNAFATARGALAVADAGSLLDALDSSGAMSLEGFRANLSMLHPAISGSRPFPGLRASLDRLRAQLVGSALWDPDEARNLQDPLTFRSLPQVNGTARDAHAFAKAQLATELNASQNNPLVVVDEDRLVSVANFDGQPLATALDLVRIGLAPAVLAASERTVKLLDASWSGLTRGLVEEAVDGLSFLGIVVQSLATEAALLAAPVSFQLASTAHAEGIEDRTALASLAARQLGAMVDVATRVAAIELVVAAQAIDLRRSPVGRGVAGTLEAIRARVPFATADEPAPPDLEPMVELIRSGLLSSSLDSLARDT